MKLKDILDLAGEDLRFKDWLKFELEHEDVTDEDGNIIAEDVAGDEGGYTFAGIDEADNPHFPFHDPTPWDVVEEYQDTWYGCGASEFPHPLGATLANYAVNMGPVPATKLLQSVLGVTVDGILGPKTIAAGNDKARDPVALSLGMVLLADKRYQTLSDNHQRLGKFLSGWLNRDNDLRDFDQTAVV